MSLWRRINTETGMFLEDVIDADVILDETGEPDPAYIDTPVPPDAGFWWPRWNGEAWEEGGTPPEPDITPPEPTPDERLKAVEETVGEILTVLEGIA